MRRTIFTCFCCVGVGVALGAIQCASAIGAGRERAQIAQNQIFEAETIIESSKIPDTNKKKIIARLNAASRETKNLGSDVDKNEKLAIKYETDAARLHTIYAVIGALALAVAGFFDVKRLI